MNSKLALMALCFVVAEPALADGPACMPLGAATAVAGKNASAKPAASELENACRKVGLEPKQNGSVSLIQVLKLALADAPRPRGDRLKPQAPAGLPTGAVIPQDGVVELDANEVSAEGLVSLDIDGPSVNVRMRPMAASGKAQIPASQLRQGAQYHWVLTTRRQKYDGAFLLADPETMKRTEARLQTLKTLNVNPATLLLLEAAIYEDEELIASRDRVIAQLRVELQK